MEEARLYKPNELYDMLGITRETLRHYTAKGLITPASVSEKGYASYSDRDALQLMTVRYYRSYDIPIDDVRKFFNEKTVEQQWVQLDEELLRLDRQIALLEQKRIYLERRRKLLEASFAQLNQVFTDIVGKEMRILLLENALCEHSAQLSRATNDMANAYPLTHIALVGSLADFLARRPMHVKVGFGCTEMDLPFLQHVDFTRMQHLPRAKCIIARMRTADPLCIPPEDMWPLYQEIQEKGYKVIGGIYGHLLSMEYVQEAWRYYITLRAHIE